ncbi:N,N-dimethylformamidase beta subunit family domain-containing protein [Rhodococcoides fascians]|uniref:N,N-dimethylformamidase beta subunit family domain-containing protein n=1 Tax=Rhodococcoides fascians TaxID=1828 RepID=UPI0012D2D6AC|nr:N,N-dimethylformamidase beta subunit family domain-containing protein [Rhodococcus fascians]
MTDNYERAACYFSSMSVAPGDPLTVHSAVRGHDTWYLDIYRIVGNEGTTFFPSMQWHARRPINPVRYSSSQPGPPTVGGADAHGCGWPAERVLESVAQEWKSGLYIARMTTETQPAPTFSMRSENPRAAGGPGGACALFVVRGGGNNNRILLQLGVATWNAYHLWNDQNLYLGDVGDIHGEDSYELRTPIVSFRRPGIGLSGRSRIHTFPPIAFQYTVPFIEFLRQEGIEIDYCTGIDIHSGAVDLSEYELLLTVGHDEYWSGPQRDAVDAFLARGGNAAYFGGNLCFWQIRYADDLTSYECYKRATHLSGGEPLDPVYRAPDENPEHDNSGVTVEFWTDPVNRSPISTIGTEMRAFATDSAGNRVPTVGAAWWWENFFGPPRPPKGFTVSAPEHWALAGTGLGKGQVFGEAQKIVGFECDGLDVEWLDKDIPVPARPDVATDTTILAYADCSDWEITADDLGSMPPGVQGRDIVASAGGLVTMIHARRGKGEIFNAPVTDWAHTLIELQDYTEIHTAPRPANPACPESRRITRNVLERMGGLGDSKPATSTRSVRENGGEL